LPAGEFKDRCNTGDQWRLSATSTAPGRIGAGEPMAEVIASFPVCLIPEIARLGRTLKQWKSAVLTYFDTFGASNRRAITASWELSAEFARDFRNFTNYRPPTPTRRRQPPPLPKQTDQPA
jgi:hypothetical protein